MLPLVFPCSCEDGSLWFLLKQLPLWSSLRNLTVSSSFSLFIPPTLPSGVLFAILLVEISSHYLLTHIPGHPIISVSGSSVFIFSSCNQTERETLSWEFNIPFSNWKHSTLGYVASVRLLVVVWQNFSRENTTHMFIHPRLRTHNRAKYGYYQCTTWWTSKFYWDCL